MKTAWDYTSLAEAYLKRPPYSAEALDKLFAICGVKAEADACDIGAGVAHLTLELLGRGLKVRALEPNDNMRKLGIERTAVYKDVQWFEATGEETGQPSDSFDLVTFGSSFNVTDRSKAMQETVRILRPQGWFICLWNHRDLDDPLQAEIEAIIKSHIADYDYGARREDQEEIIRASKLFLDVEKVEGGVRHVQTAEDVIEAWRSHATLQRQAGAAFDTIIAEIEELLQKRQSLEIVVPYVTRAWIAQSRT